MNRMRELRSETAASLLESESPSARFAWALAACCKAQLRLTPVREGILRLLSEQSVPITIETVSQHLHNGFAETTVYRTLMLFAGVDLVRLIRLQNRYSYFVLNAPGKRLEYLICRRCGSVAELPTFSAVNRIDERISSAHGYAAVYHEFGFYGICPDCRSNEQETLPITKLPARFTTGPSSRNSNKL